MQTLEQANKSAADLEFVRPSQIYWLAFLLTGHHELSLDMTLEALGFPDDAKTSFFSVWMLAWSRRVFIAKALAAIRDELAASASRTASGRAEKSALPPRTWAPERNATKVQLAPCHRPPSSIVSIRLR